MEQCKKLKEYSIFVNTVREYREDKEVCIEEAIALAVEKCIETDVLKEFLLKHREEVQTVSLGEYNFQEHMELVAKESREDALAEGMERGIEQGIEIQRIKGEEQLVQERIQSARAMKNTLMEMGLHAQEIKVAIKKAINISSADLERIMRE